MVEILDKDLKMTIMSLENEPNVYYISYQCDTKCIIEVKYNGNSVIINPILQEHCTLEELNNIIDKFSNYIFNTKPELSEMLMKTELTPFFESIGFKLINQDSEYICKNNKRINKAR